MKPDYILQYIVFGQQRFFDEALFSILSAWYYIRKSNYNIKIVVFTDNRNFFANLPVEVINITKHDWEEWAGADNYTYRGKIICINKCLEKYKKPTIFIDTDTYFKKSPDILFERLKKGYNLMHFNEGSPSLKLLSYLQYPTIKNWLTNNIKHKLSGNIWNSGVIGIPVSNISLIKKVIEFNDIYFKESRYFATEQYAFSIILDNNNTLLQSNDIVFHYWHSTLKEVFQSKFKKMLYELGEFDLELWSDSYKLYLPNWPVTLSPGIRFRAYLYKAGFFPKFRVYAPLFFMNQK